MRMGVRENSTALVGILLFASSVGACRKAPTPAPAAVEVQRPTGPEALLARVLDPWSWPTAKNATDRERAIEDIGPYEMEGADADNPNRDVMTQGPFVPRNPNGSYWTLLAGLAWDRDVDIDFDHEPVDLDGDGRPDTTVTRHIHAKGGILANPELFGLTPTPDDPRGREGRISVSTGFLGVRETRGTAGAHTGEYGMTCWLCHGANSDGCVYLGLPAKAFDYGLLLATARALGDDDSYNVQYRRARGFPSGRTVRARLLLAGPGRQDLTGEFGLDVTLPNYHSARYPGTARVRQGTRGIVNPISVPGILAAPGLALENWSGSEDAAAPWLERLIALAGRPEREVLAAFGFPRDDRGAARRALLFDLRNLGTLGLQQDSYPGLIWSDAIYGHVSLSAAAMAEIPSMYAAAPVRRALAADIDSWNKKRIEGLERAGMKDNDVLRRSVLRGQALFSERIVGTIVNRQILKHAPRAYAAAKIEGPVLAPIDPTKSIDAKLPVRCADCHAGVPLENVRPLAENAPPLGRCSHCHFSHVNVDEWRDAKTLHPRPLPASRGEGTGAERGEGILAMATLASKFGATPADEVTFCEGCHEKHRDFGPLVYSSSRLFPFDADGDGDAQGNPAADRRAGGIGTEPLLAFDVPIPQRPFTIDVATIADPVRPGRVGRTRIGASWVRAAPLVALRASAPYLHNGSVPTLRALLEPAARRPVSFPLGAAGFVLDTRVPGNGNQGHEFGTALTAAEKQDLVRFLETL